MPDVQNINHWLHLKVRYIFDKPQWVYQYVVEHTTHRSIWTAQEWSAYVDEVLESNLTIGEFIDSKTH